MNLLINEPPRRPGQPLCQDRWEQPQGYIPKVQLFPTL
jgi:hypothetical protein